MMGFIEGGFFMEKEITYRKPSLNLSGRIGKSIIETIRNTPKPDDTELKKEVEELKKAIIEAKKNGTY